MEQLTQCMQQMQPYFQEVQDGVVFVKRSVQAQGVKVVKETAAPCLLSSYLTITALGAASQVFSDSPYSPSTILLLPPVLFGVQTVFASIFRQLAEDAASVSHQKDQ